MVHSTRSAVLPASSRDGEKAMTHSKTTGWYTPGGVYLITGGSGTLALHLANHILGKGPAVVALLARRNLPSQNPAIETIKADVTDRSALSKAIGELRAKHGHIDGVFHMAAVTKDRAILSKSFSDFDTVLAPKIAGLRNVDLETRDDALRIFVGFSSIAAVLGNSGQSDYATANAFIDHYMHQRERDVAAGLASGLSLSINWPYWRDGGLHPANAGDPVTGHVSGAVPLSLEEGFETLDRICTLGESQVAVFLATRKS